MKYNECEIQSETMTYTQKQVKLNLQLIYCVEMLVFFVIFMNNDISKLKLKLKLKFVKCLHLFFL